MSIDETCKILNIEKNNLNKTVNNEVKLLSMKCEYCYFVVIFIFFLFCSNFKLFDNSASNR